MFDTLGHDSMQSYFHLVEAFFGVSLQQLQLGLSIRPAFLFSADRCCRTNFKEYPVKCAVIYTEITSLEHGSGS